MRSLLGLLIYLSLTQCGQLVDVELQELKLGQLVYFFLNFRSFPQFHSIISLPFCVLPLILPAFLADLNGLIASLSRRPFWRLLLASPPAQCARKSPLKNAHLLSGFAMIS